MLAALWIGVGPASGAGLPPCAERATALNDAPPAIDTTRYCLERVIDASDAGEIAFTALAAGEPGVLYAARPLSGEVYALRDADGDGLPESAETIAGGLTLPNALAYDSANRSLYIAAGSGVYRWREGESTTPEVLTEALPSGPGWWTGGLAVDDAGSVYVGVGTNCERCTPDAGRAALWRVDAAGTATILAEGLRAPLALTLTGGDLLISDSASVSSAEDEINRLALNDLSEPASGDAPPHFGWPDCADTASDGRDCAATVRPIFSLPPRSAPVSMARYAGDAFPWLDGHLLVALMGSSATERLEGYALLAIAWDEAEAAPTGLGAYLLPYPGEAMGMSAARGITRRLNYQGRGLWPRHLYGMAISPEGWIYLSVGGGQIYALRPR